MMLSSLPTKAIAANETIGWTITASLAGTGLYTLDLYNIMPRACHNTVNT